MKLAAVHRPKFLMLAVAIGTLTGCGRQWNAQVRQPAAAPGTTQTTSLAAKVQRLLAREYPTGSTHAIDMLGGAVRGRIESVASPRIECSKDEDGEDYCDLTATFGLDEDREQLTIECGARTSVRPFGADVYRLLNGATLGSAPALSVRRIGLGMQAMFMADTTKEGAETTSIGTAKYAALYAQGFLVMCADARPGGRKSFERVVKPFFESIAIGQHPKRPALFEHAEATRVGDTPTGFFFTKVAKRSDGEGYVRFLGFFPATQAERGQ